MRPFLTFRATKATQLMMGVLFLGGCTLPSQYEEARRYYTSHQAAVVADAAEASIPLQRGKEGRLYVVARMGRTECLLMVDTGATLTLLDERLVTGLGTRILPAPKGVLYGGGGASSGGVARIPAITLGGFELRDCPVFVTDLSEWNRREFAAQGVEIAGILGSGHLELLNAQIDYEAGVLTLRRTQQTPGREADDT